MSADEKAEAAQREARHLKWEAWTWSIVLIPISVLMFFTMSFEFFVRVTSLETLVLSVYAITRTVLSEAKAAEAKAAGYENP